MARLILEHARIGNPTVRKRGKADRARVAGSEGYEVSYFARKHGITAEQTKALLKKVGNNRDRLNKAAEKISRR